jgi:multidrug efflux pump subunit AcrA (membrane-fusion protein)
MAEYRARRRPAVRSAAAAVSVAVLLGAGFVARAYASDDPTSGYRTARASTGTVDQRLGFTGTVQRVDQQTATFAVSGQVASIGVTVGQSVTKGQQLARLDQADLEDAVVQAKAALARARATLESDQSGTSTTTSSSQGGTTALSALPAALMTGQPAATPNPSQTGSKTGQGQSVPDSVRKAQAAVAAAQAKVAAAQQTATTALATADDSCADVLDGSGPTPTGTPTGTSTTPATDPTTSTATSTSGTPDSTADDTAALASCLKAMRTAQSALHAVTAAQDSVTTAQDRLATAQQAWAQALAKQAAAAAQTSTGSTGGRTGSTGQTGTSGGTGNTSTSGTESQSGTGSRSGSTDSASRIASDEASVTQAELALKQAQTALGQATLTAPVAGTVAAVGLTVGESAGSNGITIIGGSGATVTVDVPVASIPKVAVGQEADVTPPGAVTAVKGTVQQVGLLPTETAGSAATYPVVVLVPEATATLASGARASVSILVGQAAGVVTVPNSAITTVSATSAFVTVVKGGVATRTAVTLGTVGPTRSQVSKGLAAGDTVLLADASEAIPTTTNQNRVGGGFTGGTFGGQAGGFTGGGFTGGFTGGGAVPGGTGLARN